MSEAATPNSLARLMRSVEIAALRDAGLTSDEEFQAMKRQITRI